MKVASQVASPNMLRRVNRADLARFFGVTVAEIDKWIALDCPYIKKSTGKGDEWVFDTADVANWMLDRVRRTGVRMLR